MIIISLSEEKKTLLKTWSGMLIRGLILYTVAEQKPKRAFSFWESGLLIARVITRHFLLAAG